MPRIGSFGASIRIKYKLSLAPHTPYGRVRLARFARIRLLRHALPISLLILRKKPTVLQSTRHLDVLTVYGSCKLKTRQDERHGINYLWKQLLFIQIHLWLEK